ncbi:hypothetical protein ES703_112921 [subsurface metagenome]
MSSEFESFLDLLEKFFVEDEFAFKNRSKCFPRYVVFGRAQSSHGNDDICSGESLLYTEYKIIPFIAHDCFIGNFHSQVIEPLGQIERIGVLKVRSEKFRAYGHDLDFQVLFSLHFMIR